MHKRSPVELRALVEKKRGHYKKRGKKEPRYEALQFENKWTSHNDITASPKAIVELAKEIANAINPIANYQK